MIISYSNDYVKTIGKKTNCKTVPQHRIDNFQDLGKILKTQAAKGVPAGSTAGPLARGPPVHSRLETLCFFALRHCVSPAHLFYCAFQPFRPLLTAQAWLPQDRSQSFPSAHTPGDLTYSFLF